MENYVTLFNTTYLPQALALHQSMLRHCGNFILWVVAVDEMTAQYLIELDLEHVRVVHPRQIESQDTEEIKQNRSISEYCWTLTPQVIEYVFQQSEATQRVTYLDADLWFRTPPRKLFEELEKSKAEALITEHAYAADYDQSETSGIYCVQFLTFSRQAIQDILLPWRDQCVSWCFNRSEGGLFGDQGYLNDWPQKYGRRIHVLSEKSLAQGPWNATRFPFSEGAFFHFHGLKIISENKVDIGLYRIPRPTYRNVYIPYMQDLAHARGVIQKSLPGLSADCFYQVTGLPLRRNTQYLRSQLGFLYSRTLRFSKNF